MGIILLTGIPGTGKTKIGNQLKNNYDFYHVDLENPEKHSSPEFLHFSYSNINANQLMQKIKNKDKNAVITWGFYPKINDPIILKLQELGANMFWMDGDRGLAKEAWRRRDDPIEDSLFDLQISRIDNHDIQGIFSPININAFENSTRKHKDIEKVIQEIFGYL